MIGENIRGLEQCRLLLELCREECCGKEEVRAVRGDVGELQFCLPKARHPSVSE